MSIFNHFQHLTLSSDQETALTKLETFFNGSNQVFMLKGSAGTGKTMLIKGVTNYLAKHNKNYLLMAPTGRAAKVLRDKTGYGSTIHKGIYNFEKLVNINSESKDEAEHSLHYCFPLQKLSAETIIIVDESSMISSKESKNELFSFGTDVLLSDLLTFASLNTTSNKLIFVGDPAQLTPVGDNKSLALESSFYKKLGLSFDEIEMKDVKRQSNNLILQNATIIRDTINSDNPTKLTLEYDETSFVRLETTDIVQTFTNLFPIPEIGNGVIINYSNGQCYHLNKAIREVVFPNQPDIVAGDVIMINNNNYHTYGVELYNGDFAKVLEVFPGFIEQSAPIYKDINGKKTRVVIKITFKKIVIRVPNHSEDISCFIIDSLLNSIDRDLSVDEIKALYINFIMRFNEIQGERRDRKLPSFKVGSEEFKLALKSDPFFNALRIKYGYSITCHKAQGGEWESVFVDYSGRISLKKDPLRWSYTATTRGINTVYALNAPHFGEFSKFKISPIGKIGKLPTNSLVFDNVQTSPFHKDSQHLCKSHKYWQIRENLESLNCQIELVQSFDFLEKYTIVCNDEKLQLEGYHKGSGHFSDGFHLINPQFNEMESKILEKFNENKNYKSNFSYSSEIESLTFLHNIIESLCLDLEINITNIVEEKSFISFYFISNSICSYIQFYFNSKFQLTTAMPKTYNCNNDIKLSLLIQKIQDYAI